MPNIMIQGTMSGAGKSTITAAVCRILSDEGYSVAPFKSQNMSRYVHGPISRAQAVQAAAARRPATHDMNPIVLVPRGDAASMVVVRGEERGAMTAAQYYEFAAREGMDISVRALRALEETCDVVVLEGAGSPAEINIPFDLANMRMAEAASAGVVIVSDIERGGCFAQMAGTASLLEPRHRIMVEGFVVNKFRGEYSILEPGLDMIREITGIPVIGVVPHMETRLPAEDSLDAHAHIGMDSPGLEGAIERTARIVRAGLDVHRILDMAGPL